MLHFSPEILEIQPARDSLDPTAVIMKGTTLMPLPQTRVLASTPLLTSSFAVPFGMTPALQGQSDAGRNIGANGVYIPNLISCAAAVYVYTNGAGGVLNVAIFHAHTGYIPNGETPLAAKYNINGVGAANIHVVFASSQSMHQNPSQGIQTAAEGVFAILGDGIPTANLKIITGTSKRLGPMTRAMWVSARRACGRTRGPTVRCGSAFLRRCRAPTSPIRGSFPTAPTRWVRSALVTTRPPALSGCRRPCSSGSSRGLLVAGGRSGGRTRAGSWMWMILNQPGELDDAQVAQFQSQLGANARPVQALNGRSTDEYSSA